MRTLADLRSLCAATGASDPSEQFTAVHWTVCEGPTLALALVESAWQYVFHGRTHVTFSSPEVARAMGQEAVLIESALRSMSAGVDMLAQLVNAALLAGKVQPAASDFTKQVLCELRARPDEYSELLHRIAELWGSPECGYVEAFVNTIKHRKLVRPVRHSVKFAVGHEYKEGAEFAECEYKSATYPAKHRSDLAEDTRALQRRVEAIWDEIGLILERRATRPC